MLELQESHLETLREISEYAEIPDDIANNFVSAWVEECEECETYCEATAALAERVTMAALLTGHPEVTRRSAVFVTLLIEFDKFLHDPTYTALDDLLSEFHNEGETL